MASRALWAPQRKQTPQRLSLPELRTLGTPAQHTEQAFYAGRSVMLERGACHLSMLGLIKLKVIQERYHPRWGQLDLVVSDGSPRGLRAQ